MLDDHQCILTTHGHNNRTTVISNNGIRFKTIGFKKKQSRMAKIISRELVCVQGWRALELLEVSQLGIVPRSFACMLATARRTHHHTQHSECRAPIKTLTNVAGTRINHNENKM